MKALTIAVAVLAAPALAQELPFEPAPLETCLSGNGPAAACVGMAAEACISTPDGYSTAGMSYCYHREAEYWDERLNAAYNKLIQLHKDQDEEMKGYGLPTPPTAPFLRDMQRAWISYRDAACAYERSTWGGGTGGGPASAACLMQITAAQALELEGRLAALEQQ